MAIKIGNISVDLNELTDKWVEERPMRSPHLSTASLRDLVSSSVWSNARKAVKHVNNKGIDPSHNEAHSLIWRFVYRDIVSRIKNLCKDIQKAKYEYYILDNPSISDVMYDVWYKNLEYWNEFLTEKDEKLQKEVDLSLSVGYNEIMEGRENK